MDPPLVIAQSQPHTFFICSPSLVSFPAPFKTLSLVLTFLTDCALTLQKRQRHSHCFNYSCAMRSLWLLSTKNYSSIASIVNVSLCDHVIVQCSISVCVVFLKSYI